MPVSPRGPTSPKKKSTASPPVSPESPRKAGSPRKEQPSGEGRRSPRSAGQEKSRSAAQEQRKAAPAASAAQSPRSAGRTPAASGAQSPRSAGGSRASANGPAVLTKEQKYWEDPQPVGGRVEAYGVDVCAKLAERHQITAASKHANKWRVGQANDGPRKGVSSIASSRRERKTDRKNPSELPRAGCREQPRVAQPMVVSQFRNTLEFVPLPRSSNASVVSRVSTDGELTPSEYENIKHHVGERLHAKHTSVMKAFRTTGVAPNSFEFGKADLHNTFKAYGYNRKVSDRFFNTMDKDKSNVISMAEFNKAFGCAIHPEYEQEKGGHGYMATTQRFFFDSKQEYDPPHEHHGFIRCQRH